MAVIRFPIRGNAVRQAEEDFREFGVDSPGGDGSGEEGHDGFDGDFASLHDEFGREETQTPPPRAPRKKGRGPSPAEVLARSVAGAASRGTRLTPAQVIAQALSPVPAAASPEYLRQSFWAIWLQHHDYLKKKASTSWTGTARRLTTS